MERIVVNDERTERRRFLRRLVGARGSLYLEFALVSPLWLALACFTIDFAHLTLVRQQLEVCSRVIADLESRSALSFGKRTAQAPAVDSVRTYLAHATNHPLTQKPRAGRSDEEVFVRLRQAPMPLQPIGAYLSGKGDSMVSDGKLSSSAKAAKAFFSSALKGILNLVSFRAVRYLTEVIAEDFAVGVSVSAKTETLFPASIYTIGNGDGRKVFGGGYSEKKSRWELLLLQQDIVSDTAAERYYCYMPNMETSPKRPSTYINTLTGFFDKVKKKFGVK